MNKIFKTKYDVTTGQCKAVSELASNRQIASSSEKKPKCGANLKRTSLSENLLFNMLISGLVLFAYPAWAAAAQTSNNDKDIKIDGNTMINGNSVSSPSTGKGHNDIMIGNEAEAKKNDTSSSNGNSVAQRVVLGNKAYAIGNQAVGIGGDVFAQGYSSIAIGSDDIGETADEKQKDSGDKYSKYAVPLLKPSGSCLLMREIILIQKRKIAMRFCKTTVTAVPTAKPKRVQSFIAMGMVVEKSTEIKTLLNGKKNMQNLIKTHMKNTSMVKTVVLAITPKTSTPTLGRKGVGRLPSGQGLSLTATILTP
ncbi:hypothetical protein FWK45_04830 [Histophilus somni]|uniref:Uncharacterized protein n=1 Tax=Histophilus somni TaxID=731 RepID=A0AAX2S440_HISSO|nr:ESPR-type extended signal peptide-containing protein [Histophilus somni]QEH08962.1 hypothetical protein FWK43_05385 [Histophilus somni]QEH12458.1 hypothetical protein FWK44_04830 [Histophilus somni]QEH25236.1 hypothetical protein FWK61_05390 [Histophilus somni]QEH26939.1 hypothetical protein FWK62_04850 [Histophilus somni]QEH51133.1 hypothetical protein FWK45_04830 [Histophilus somni]